MKYFICFRNIDDNNDYFDGTTDDAGYLARTASDATAPGYLAGTRIYATAPAHLVENRIYLFYFGFILLLIIIHDFVADMRCFWAWMIFYDNNNNI